LTAAGVVNSGPEGADNDPMAPGRRRRAQVAERARRHLAPSDVLRLVAVAYLSGAASLLFWSHAPVLVGWQPRVVISGSMLPSIRPGDIALIGPATPGRSTLPPGRIALVRDPTRSTGSYLHRVARYKVSGAVVTRGDANSVDDYPAVDPSRIEGQVRLIVPAVGLPMLWWHDHQWVRLAGLGAVSWTSLVLVLGFGRARSTGVRSRRW
jgi:signal peptidase I